MKYIICLILLFCSTCVTAPTSYEHLLTAAAYKHYSHKTDGTQSLHVVSGEDIPNFDLLADVCWVTILITKEEWAREFGADHLHRVKDFAVLFVEEIDDDRPGTAAIITRMNVGGKFMPTAVVRIKYLNDVFKDGWPVGHELLHALRDDYIVNDLNHVYPWYKENSIDHSARNRLRRIFAVKKWRK